jgi:hypothetical protein
MKKIALAKNFTQFLFFFYTFFFLKKKGKKNVLKKQKLCVKCFTNVVKNKVLGKLYFHFIPIYEVHNSGQNIN